MRLALAGLVALACVACEGRPRRSPSDEAAGSDAEVSGPRVVELDLRGGVTERGATSLFAASSNHFTSLVLALRDLQHRRDVRGVFVRLGAASIGLARAEEFGREGQLLRAKVPVVCHADGLDNATLLAASLACTEVWLSPAGSVDSVGLAAQLVFARTLFDKLGVKVDFMQEGRFKGAEEPFTRDEPSEPARKSLEATLLALRQTWLEGIEHGRERKADALGVEDGPHGAEAARQLHLIDHVGFEVDARARALELAGVTARSVAFGGSHDGGGLGELLRAVAGSPRIGVPHVAVVRATGAIGMGGGSGLGRGDGISRRELGATLRRLEKDPLVRAVVVRIDSPGGSALASDLLWRDLMDLRKEKPVVFSIGSMAASGGYYLASAGTKIVAERGSIIGSIGVVMGKLSVGDTLGNLGVHVTVVPAKPDGGARAAYLSPFVAWDDPTRAKLSASMKQVYRLFLERIAEGRGVDVSAIEPAAEGRIMGGDDAKTRGLIDEIGGLSRSLELAKNLAKEPPELPVHVVEGGTDWLGLMQGDDAAEADGRRPLDEQAEQKLREALVGSLGGDSPLFDDLSACASVFAPLARGEHALAASPFFLHVR